MTFDFGSLRIWGLGWSTLLPGKGAHDLWLRLFEDLKAIFSLGKVHMSFDFGSLGSEVLDEALYSLGWRFEDLILDQALYSLGKVHMTFDFSSLRIWGLSWMKHFTPWDGALRTWSWIKHFTPWERCSWPLTLAHRKSVLMTFDLTSYECALFGKTLYSLGSLCLWPLILLLCNLFFDKILDAPGNLYSCLTFTSLTWVFLGPIAFALLFQCSILNLGSQIFFALITGWKSRNVLAGGAEYDLPLAYMIVSLLNQPCVGGAGLLSVILFIRP
jgi:hypothetical protein